MDLDAQLKKHANAITEIKAFIGVLSDLPDAGELAKFKAAFEGVLPELRQAVTDTQRVVADIEAMREQLAPVIAWVQAQMAEADTAKRNQAVQDLKAGSVADKIADQNHNAAEQAASKPAEPVGASLETKGPTEPATQTGDQAPSTAG